MAIRKLFVRFTSSSGASATIFLSNEVKLKQFYCHFILIYIANQESLIWPPTCLCWPLHQPGTGLHKTVKTV